MSVRVETAAGAMRKQAEQFRARAAGLMQVAAESLEDNRRQCREAAEWNTEADKLEQAAKLIEPAKMENCTFAEVRGSPALEEMYEWARQNVEAERNVSRYVVVLVVETAEAVTEKALREFFDNPGLDNVSTFKVRRVRVRSVDIE